MLRTFKLWMLIKREGFVFFQMDFNRPDKVFLVIIAQLLNESEENRINVDVFVLGRSTSLG